MPRRIINDHLQVYKFWLADISPLDSLSLPILNPLLGFSYITAPEITADILSIKEGNWPFPRKMIVSANVNSITLKRGVLAYDRDFYNWMMHGITGRSQSSIGNLINKGLNFLDSNNINVSPRRTLALIQFFSKTPFSQEENISDSFNFSSSASNTAGTINNGRDGTSLLATDSAEQIGMFGPMNGNVRLIPARLFILKDCIPSRYKISQDFDPKSGEVSVQELTIEYEGLEQITLV